MGVLARLGIEGPVALWAPVVIVGAGDILPVVARVTRAEATHPFVRGRHALLLDPGAPTPADGADGFAAVLGSADAMRDRKSLRANGVVLPPELSYLDDEDVVRIDARRRRVDVLYRRWSEHNSLLVTERCNSRCLMCSQPPRFEDDSHLVDDVRRAIELMHPETREIGLTGGEPTLLFGGLIDLIRTARDALPTTQLHILSNGRLFAYLRYAAQIAAVRHPGLVFGVPVYSDLAGEHDYVVQASGAFDQTLRGLLNLARYGIRVEIRVVVHGATYLRLPQLAEFIARNLSFAEHVALMGLETIGYTRRNLAAVWVDPADYQPELVAAAEHLDRAGLRVSIYNHQLCVLDPRLWRFAVRSISDWKNIYVPECEPCIARSRCGGFFASATHRYSSRIRPIIADAPAESSRSPGVRSPSSPATERFASSRQPPGPPY
jgi:His-Xaa-Ser system radical SAM maturase HxsC